MGRFIIGKKLLKNLNVPIIVFVLSIAIFGTMNIYSATYLKVGNSYLKLQLLWIFFGIVLIYGILLIDYSFVANYAKVIYWASVALLAYNDITSKAIKGAAAWIRIGNRAIEPGEFAKLGLALMLSKKINDMNGEINKPKNILTILIYAGIPMALIIIQPDMGMTMICFFIVLGIVYIGGINSKILICSIIGVGIMGGLVWNSGIIKPYQKARMTAFLNQDASDPLGDGLQLKESEIAIGSGGIFGKGYLNGTQISGGFVPEDHTDFIFSVVGEEWGLVGGGVLLFFYLMLILNINQVSKRSKDRFGQLMCVGIGSSLLFSVFQNMGMTIGVMPISGITLPFMSYGGSSILANCIGIGLVLNVGMRRNKINF
ncbi:MAG: rod shape-determining protein RodA [Bacillota bacterium]|nr:rod shape-determining protein RodA [Bacillota bacterium]